MRPGTGLFVGQIFSAQSGESQGEGKHELNMGAKHFRYFSLIPADCTVSSLLKRPTPGRPSGLGYVAFGEQNDGRGIAG